jgi:heavy metal translocating P-type ATPase
MTPSATVANQSLEAFLQVKEPPFQAPAIPIRRVREPVVAARFALVRDGSATARLVISDPGIITDPRGALARAFYARVLAVANVESVFVDASEGRAEVRFRSDDGDLKATVRKLSAALKNPEVSKAQPIAVSDYLGRGPRVELFRHGSWISTWRVKHEITGRIRLHNPALLRRTELRQSITGELTNTFGVDRFSTQELTGSVLIHFNPAQIQKHQIIEILDLALEKAPDNGPSPVDFDLPVSIAAMAIATVSTFVFPALAPLSAAVFLYSVIPSFKGAYRVLFKERRLGVDLLDTIVVVACLATNNVFAGTFLGLSLAISRKLVQVAEQNSKRMLVSVFGKQSRFVWLDKDGVEIETPLEKLQVGDIIIVHTGESVPADGEVVDGMAMVDQHALTGESAPVEKIKGDRVLAATTLIAGKIRVAVTSAGADTTSAKIAQILNDTSGYTLSAQSRGEKLADWAVVPTLGLGTVTLAVRGINNAVAVINCDLGTGIRMAAPIAMLSSLTLCAQQGILVKSGRALETIYDVDTFLFDKTGTLTRERPEVGRIVTFEGYDENQILRWTAAAENKFSHPIAKAILDKFSELGLPMPKTDDSKYSVGYGITVAVEGHIVRVGSARFMKHESVPFPSELEHEIARVHHDGNSLIMVAVDDRLGGAIELRAADRSEVADVIAGLRARGAEHLAIISGDHERPTRKLAERLGMDRFFAEVLPQDKAGYVETLQKEGRRVCFIGDGVNDSIALKKADVSISLRGASSIATDTAQIVFMEENLQKLLQVHDISRGLQNNIDRSWQMIVGANLICVAGALFSNFGIMHSMVFNQIGGLLSVGNGLLPLRKAAQLQREKDQLAEFLAAHAALGLLPAEGSHSLQSNMRGALEV